MKDVGKVGSVALCALLPAALIAGVPLVAGAASATTPTSSTTPPSIRLGGLTAVPAQRIDLAGGVRAHRKKSLKVIGRAGIPSAGVSSLKARVTVRSSRAGKITIYPSATSGGRVTIAVRAGKSVSKTVTIKIGTKGRWTFQNKTGGKLRAHPWICLVVDCKQRDSMWAPSWRTSLGTCGLGGPGEPRAGVRRRKRSVPVVVGLQVRKRHQLLGAHPPVSAELRSADVRESPRDR